MRAMIERPPYALLRTMRARVAVLGPLDVVIDDADYRQVPEFATLHSIAPRRGQCYACKVDAEFIEYRQWWLPLHEDDRTIVFAYAGPLHGGGGSDPIRVIATLAVIIAAYYFGPAVGSFMGLTGNAAAAAGSAIITIAGTTLVNALLPPPTVAAGGLGSGQTASPTYQTSLQGNQARLGDPIPVRYGQERFLPDEAARPYYEYDENNDQFYCTTLCVGYGREEVLRVELDDTDYRYFSDASIAICGPGQTALDSPYPTFESLADQTLVADNIVTAKEIGAQELISAAWVGASCPTRAGFPINRVFFDVALRLATIDKEDGEPKDRSLTLQFRMRPIDDNGQPLAGWLVLGSRTVVNGNLDTVRRTFAFDVADGRYHFSMRRTQLRSDNQRAIDDVQWIGLRGRLNRRGITRDDCTYVVLRVRANEQLSGSQKRVNVIAKRLISIYDPETLTWSAPTFTRNPAHAFADILHESVTGRGLPDRRIDLLGLADLADTYADRQDRFDYSFDRRGTVHDALRLVARAGRGVPNLRRGSVYSLVRDQLQTVPVALFMPRNSKGFRLNYRLPKEEAPDAVRLTYRDGQVWGDRVVWGQLHAGRCYAYPDGERPGTIPTPERVQDERLAGVIGEKHALREVLFLIGDAYMRRQPVDWTTELEGTLPAKGSLVGTAHDVARWAQSGDVKDYDGGTLTLKTSEPLTFGTGAHYVRLQTNTGGAGEAIQVTAGATAYEMVLGAPPAQAPVFDDAGRERTRYLFGSLKDVTRYVLVRGLRRQGSHDVIVEGVVEVPDVHALDEDLLPKPGETQDALLDTKVEEGSVDGDPYFGAVVLLPGLVGGTLVDQSPAERVLDLHGSPAITTVDPAVGDYSVALNDDDWISVENTTYFGFGRQPWTIEGRWRINAYGGGDGITPFEPLLDFRREQDEFGAVGILEGSPHRLMLRRDDHTYGSSAGASIPLATVVELAMTWDGNKLRGFKDGVMQFELDDVPVNFGSKKQLRIGRNYSGSNSADANNYRLRVTAGVCRYTDDYSVPARYPRQ